ncbi:MAG: GNAT family N-acetyltransferase [Bacteroidales bacterium]
MLANKRIQLRAPEPEDLDVFYRWENDSDLWSYGTTITPFSRFILKEYIASGGGDLYQTRQLRLMIIDKSENKTVGMVDLFDFDPFHRRAAIGILVDPNSQGKGLATQALLLLDAYAFRFLGIHMLYAHIPVNNTASKRLFEKSGFEIKGTLSDWIRVNESYEDVIIVQKKK